MKTLLLYTTQGCHLCETAKKLAWPVMELYGFKLQEVEIVDSEALMERYAIRIPVVAREDSGAELGWPFDQEQLAALLIGQLD